MINSGNSGNSGVVCIIIILLMVFFFTGQKFINAYMSPELPELPGLI
jgi:hypothetical protein